MMVAFGYLIATGVLHSLLVRTALPVGVPEFQAEQKTADIIYLPFAEDAERKAA